MICMCVRHAMNFSYNELQFRAAGDTLPLTCLEYFINFHLHANLGLSIMQII